MLLDWILLVEDWISLDLDSGSALDQHWIHEILAAAGRAVHWIVLDRYWIGSGSVLDLYWIGLDLTGFAIQSRGSPIWPAGALASCGNGR